MKKLIFCAYAIDDKKQTGVNVLHQNNAENIYYENICVALLSAKMNNPDDDVALVTNHALPEKYKDFFGKNNLLVFNKEFDNFVFDNNCKWGLAFYKLCALEHVVNDLDYDYIVMVDCDTFTQFALNNVWNECDENILVYDICHGLQVNDYQIFLNDVEHFFGERVFITHYGGEFVAGKKDKLISFVQDLQKVYLFYMKNNICIECGDETILSIAAHIQKEKVKNAGAYIYRFWTGTFRLTSTCYIKNPVAILHLPDEKTKGLRKIFKKFYKNKKISNKRIASICHLNKPSFSTWIKMKIKGFKH